MKPLTSLATVLVAAALLGLAGCDKKTSDDLQQRADEAGKRIEAKAKEAKDAAGPKLKELQHKGQQVAKDAGPQLKQMGDKAKGATVEVLEKTRDAADAAASKLKDSASPTPTPAP